MSRISWGKPRIFVKDKDDSSAKWKELITPAEGTTQLNVQKGDKIEAKIEGGENEDVKYKRSTYQTMFNIRKGKMPDGTSRPKPFPSIDGRVDHHYSLLIQPEDPTCEGIYVEDNTVTVDDTFNTTDGGMWEVQMDALKASVGDTVKWGVVTLSTSGTGSSATNTIAFAEGSSFDSGGDEGTSAFVLPASEVILAGSTVTNG